VTSKKRQQTGNRTTPHFNAMSNYTVTDFSQVKGSPEADAAKWKGSRGYSEQSEDTPIEGWAPLGASGSRADGSKVGSLSKNSFPGARGKASRVSNMRATASGTANHLTKKQAEVGEVATHSTVTKAKNIHGKKNANGNYKYKDITTLIRKNRITVLAIQECRLNKIEQAKIELMCPMLSIISNSSSTAKEGVAFLINKDLVKDKKIEHKILVRNRMSRLTLRWNEDVLLDIINVHVPNNEKEKISFLKEAKHIIRNIKNKEDLMIMGDFNYVEDKIDRLPMTKDVLNVLYQPVMSFGHVTVGIFV
jgi:hypothetical protein